MTKFGTFPREFPKFPNIWEVPKFPGAIPQIPMWREISKILNIYPPQIPEGNLGSSKIPFLGKVPKGIPQFPRNLGSSQVSQGNSPNSHLEVNFQNFKNEPLSFPKGIWEVPKFLFFRDFPREFPKFLDIWEVPKFLCFRNFSREFLKLLSIWKLLNFFQESPSFPPTPQHQKKPLNFRCVVINEMLHITTCTMHVYMHMHRS